MKTCSVTWPVNHYTSCKSWFSVIAHEVNEAKHAAWLLFTVITISLNFIIPLFSPFPTSPPPFLCFPLSHFLPLNQFCLLSSLSLFLFLLFSFFSPLFLHFCLLLVVGGAALPLAGVVHAGRADGAGDEVGRPRGHEVSHCRRDVHPLVCHQVICRQKKHKHLNYSLWHFPTDSVNNVCNNLQLHLYSAADDGDKSS